MNESTEHRYPLARVPFGPLGELEVRFHGLVSHSAAHRGHPLTSISDWSGVSRDVPWDEVAKVSNDRTPPQPYRAELVRWPGEEFWVVRGSNNSVTACRMSGSHDYTGTEAEATDWAHRLNGIYGHEA